MHRSEGKRMLNLQIQGVLQLGVEDHLASSLTTGDRGPEGLFPTSFRQRWSGNGASGPSGASVAGSPENS